MVYILAAYDPDYTDDISLKFDPPQHGNLTLYRQVKIVNLIEQDCSQPWDTRRPKWDELTKLISGLATMTEVSLPNPCGTDFVTRKLAWVVTVFKYRPFVGYIGENVIKVRHILTHMFILLSKGSVTSINVTLSSRQYWTLCGPTNWLWSCFVKCNSRFTIS